MILIALSVFKEFHFHILDFSGFKHGFFGGLTYAERTRLPRRGPAADDHAGLRVWTASHASGQLAPPLPLC